MNEETSSDQLRQAVQDHISSEVARFEGKVHDWTVVNEAVDSRGELKQNIFLNKLGEGYIAEAFRIAHEADPGSLLIYNDYWAEAAGGAKSDGVYNLVRKLLAEGVPIGGVGLQMHIDAWNYPDPRLVAANVHRLVQLGLKVFISEMDVRISGLQGDLQSKLDTQRRVYHDIISACVSEKGFAGVTFWGFTDAYSWINNHYGPDQATLFDENYQPKPAYWGVMQALLGG